MPLHTSSDDGFTLIELMVVILIIGILAAIALPAFLGQRAKGQDASAKSDARNFVSQLEACWHADGTGYTGCSAKLTALETGLDVGTGAGQVSITQETQNGYVITATSRADTGGASHVFKIVHNIGGLFDRQCTPQGKGACQADGSW